MAQMAKIGRVLTKGYAEILLPRDLWQCDGSCIPCQKDPCPLFDGDCDRAVAENHTRAERGDLVEIRAAQARRDRSYQAVYVVPVLMFFAGCFLGRLLGQSLLELVLTGAILALLTFTIAWIMNRGNRMRQVISYEVVQICRPADRDAES